MTASSATTPNQRHPDDRKAAARGRAPIRARFGVNGQSADVGRRDLVLAFPITRSTDHQITRHIRLPFSVSLCLRGEISASDLALTQFFPAVYCVRVRTSDFKALAWLPTR